MRQNNHFYALIFLMPVVAFLAYSNIINAPFVFDDLPNIVQSPHLRMTDLSPDCLVNATKGPSPFRPVAYFSFAINYYFGRYNVVGYHLTNIVIHIAVAMLLFWLSIFTLSLTGIKQKSTPIFAALAWLLHPLHIQSVTYTVQRINSLAVLFYMLGLFLYIQARITQQSSPPQRLKCSFLFIGCVVSGLLAIFSKEIAITLPVFIFLYEYFFFQRCDFAWLKRPTHWLVPIFVMVLVIAIVFLKADPIDRILDSYSKQEFSMGQRLLTEPRVVVYYLSLLFFPHSARLNIDYDFPLSTSLGTPAVNFLAITAIGFLLLAALYRPSHHRLISFSILWFLGNLIIESTFICLALIFEHRTYLPSIFPALLCTILLTKLTPRPLAVIIFCLFIVTGGLWTYQRNNAWKDPFTLWRDCAAKSPRRARPANGVGVAYQLRQQPEKAMAWFNKAIDLDPTYHEAYSNIAVIFIENGRPADALPHLYRAISLNPESYEAFNVLGSAMHRLNRLDEAVAYHRKSLTIFPDYETAHNNLGAVLAEKGDIAGAVRHLRQALRINPAYPEPYNNLGLAMMRQGRLSEAIGYYRQALSLNPDYTTAHFNLGTACFQNRDLGCAANHLRQAARLDPGSVLTLNNLTSVLVLQKEYHEAGDYLTRLADLMPDSPTVFYNLACVHALQNNKNAAVDFLKQAVAKGYDRWDHLKNDPDLQNIRDTEYFHQLTQ